MNGHGRPTRGHSTSYLSVGCNPGDTGFVSARSFEFALGQNLVLLRADGEKILKPFLRWLVRSPAWWNQIDKYLNVGAVFDSLKCVDIPEFVLPIPPLHDQRVIAHILSTLDDKIELNRRMNATLESMARALFRSWFVDFDPVRAKMEGRGTGLPKEVADLFPDRLVGSELGEMPEGWSVGSLGDIAEPSGTGVDPTSVERDTPYIGLEHMPRHSVALTDWGSAGSVSSNKSGFSKGDVLFGKLRPYFHKVGIRACGRGLLHRHRRPHGDDAGTGRFRSCICFIIRVRLVHEPDFDRYEDAANQLALDEQVRGVPARGANRRSLSARCGADVGPHRREHPRISRPRCPPRCSVAETGLRRDASARRREARRSNRMTETLLSGPDEKEGLSLAYVKALAARAGFATAVPEPDRDSVDVRIMAGGPRRPALDLQLKATADLAEVQDGFRQFRLRIKNYNDLRVETQTPRLLVVLDLPWDRAQWMTVTAEELVLRRRAYWMSLQQGHEEVVSQETVTVRIPEGNVLDVVTLQTLMEQSRSGDI